MVLFVSKTINLQALGRFSQATDSDQQQLVGTKDTDLDSTALG